MPRKYRHIQQYEEEMVKLKEDGLTLREIGERFGLSYEQTHDFFKKHNRRQRKITAGIAIKRQGRPSKCCAVTERDEVSELKYILAQKEAKIKSLEMENKLMRDYLSLTGRK